MEFTEFTEILNEDLANELKHLLFYLRSAAMVRGVHRNHLAKFFKEQAQGEMEHVLAFSTMIVSMGGIPTDIGDISPDPSTEPAVILRQAIDLEEEVVQNYTDRIAELELMLADLRSDTHEATRSDEKDSARIQYLILFFEEQVEDSHGDLDNLREMVHGVY